MLRTNHGRRSIDDLLGLYRSRKLNLSPAFQRRSVWNRSDRQKLVLSVLDGIPLPTIYLYRQMGSGGRPKYDVIDGKQRIETLLLFMGKGPLAGDDDLCVRTAIGEDSLDWWQWHDLPNDLKHQFLSTEIPTIEVDGDLADVIDLFVRINSTGMRLTGQEKRHAQYYQTPILRAAQHFADTNRDFFQRNGILTPSQLRRMKHVELSTELLLAIRSGQPLNKKSSIDKVIDNSAVAADMKSAAIVLQRAIRYVETVLPDLRTTRFRNTIDFYTLCLLLNRLKDEGAAISAHASTKTRLAGALLREFGLAVDEVNEQLHVGNGIRSDQETYRAYLMTVRADTDSFKQRMARERLLREVLTNVFDDVDACRSFTPTQRRIVWHASRDKKCSLCGKPVRAWSEMTVDHITPYSKGGKTDLGNAALAHARCNSRAGAKHTVS